MAEQKQLYIIDSDRIFEEKISRSTFICHLRKTADFTEAKLFITEISEKHKNATHNCWAYILGSKADISHSSDNGEPSGTAGKPMLNALLKHDLTFVTAVVTRYFGGVKLGVRGLIEAYGSVVDKAILEQALDPLIFKKQYHIVTDYHFFDTFKYQLKSFKTDITDLIYTDRVELTLEVEETLAPELEAFLNDAANSRKIEFVNQAE